MADKDKDRFVRQYDYKANSNLVLPSQTDKRANQDETGEVKSLTGRISGRMGDRITSKPTVKPLKQDDFEHKQHKKSRKHQRRTEPSLLKQDLSETKGLSVADLDTKDFIYLPKSEQTRGPYGLIINFVKKTLGFYPDDVITLATNEVIGSIRHPNKTDEERREEVNGLLLTDGRVLDDDEYNNLCNLCKKINDWEVDQAKINEDVAEEKTGEIGVVDVDDDDGSSDEYMSEIQDSDDEIDLDDMFEKAQEVDLMKPFAPMEIHDDSMSAKYRTLNLEELSKRQTDITPKIEIGDPVRKPGYQEYTIVPSKPEYRNVHLVDLRKEPEDIRKAFKNFKTLNVVQSAIYKHAIESDESLLICAPTGAGKTNIAVLTMLREILKHKDEKGFQTDKFKIIYVAPIKALVQEIVRNFTERLGGEPYNLKVREFTGDHQLDQRELAETQIIVCTPEKWDIVTRKSTDRLYTKIVKLVIFDEIHLLHNERGATLESLVARIKRHKQIEGHSIRIIGLSATLKNYHDVAHFIAPDPKRPGRAKDESYFYFNSTYRPIPLLQQYIAITETKKAFKIVNDIVYEKVIERLEKEAQILIFVHSRPDTVKTAESIKMRAIDEHRVGLFLSSTSAIEQINESGDVSPKVKELLQFGIGVHHAALSPEDRECVERLFRERYIKVIVSTATLAWGVNLPARTVIIKGTQVYKDGKWCDLDSLDITQMLGRAGRPGFDTQGEGIVITQQSQVQFYMSLINEQLPVESRLIGRLPEFINAECVVGNIESLDDAVTWLSETYLNSRMLSILDQPNNKQYLTMYGIDPESKQTDRDLTFHKHNLAYTAACLLDDRGLIDFDRISGVMKSTELGRIASHYNCSSKTIKLFYDSIHEHTSDIELLRTFSLADEFKDVYVRAGDEMNLQMLLNQVPFPIDDKRATPGANKVNALLQVYIFHLNIEGTGFISDLPIIQQNAARLASAIHEIVVMKGYALVAELSFDLCRKIAHRMTVCHSPLRQFLRSNDPLSDTVARLEKKNYHIDELRVLEANKISELLRCDQKTGKKVYNLLKCLPKLKIEASVKPISKSSLKVELMIEPDFVWDKNFHKHSERFWVLVQDVNQEVILHYEIVHVKEYTDFIVATFFVPYLIPVHPFYYVRILPDNWFGCDHHLPIYLEKLTMPDENLIITQPLDLEPYSFKSLGNSSFEQALETKFSNKVQNFNQIQTQSFKQLYLSDDDLILLASAGSGKTTCAELAILRNINNKQSNSKCGYIAANRETAQSVYKNWREMFGHLDQKVILLTAKYSNDVAEVDKDESNIVVGDAKSWYALSLIRAKPKKYRKLFNKFQLIIIDDIHLLHSDKNSTLEWVCSKIRTIAENPPRIVALGSPVTCVDSLKSWLRTTKEPILLNYPINMRPVKLELSIQEFYHYDYEMRLLTMQRPVYRYVDQLTRDKTSIIFVADHHQALQVCESFKSYSKNEKHPFREVTGSSRQQKLYSNEKGIACIFNGMEQRYQDEIENMFARGEIQVLVVTVAMCWSIQSRSYMTIVMDAQQHNGLEASDYELTDVMQMVGLTGRPLLDHECRAIIMCQVSKSKYYDRFLREPLSIESELPANLIAHINFEISTGSLKDLSNIYKPYLAHTFFYKRITINPNYYGIVGNPNDSEQKAELYGNFFNNLVNKVSLDLEKAEFITMEGSHENPEFGANLLSKISLEYHINYETMLGYTKYLKTDSRTSELIQVISSNTLEFNVIPVRHGELNALRAMKDRYRCHDDDYHSQTSKVKFLILSQYQKTNGREDKVEGELIADRRIILTTCYRLIMAIVEVAWIKDYFSLAKTSITLAKRLLPFSRLSQPQLDMEITNIDKTDGQVTIDIIVKREDQPYSLEEFEKTTSLPVSVFRGECWYFMIHCHLKPKGESEKFLEFKRIKTPPSRGDNDYKLEFTLPENADAYTYDLYFMSDFYAERDTDRKVPNILGRDE